MFGRVTADVAVDLGTSKTRVVVRGRGIVLEEPSVVAIQRGGPHSREKVHVGAAARDMLGRAPAGVEVVRPIRGGVIADFEATEQVLYDLLRRASGRGVLRPRVLASIPSETTEVERRAVQESIRSAGGRDVTLVAAPLAAALGAELPIGAARGSMIVDVGAGQTEVAVTSLGGMVVVNSVRVAGDAINEAITHHARSRESLVLGEQTAELVKRRIGCAMPLRPARAVRVRGRDLVSGHPREAELTSDAIRDAIAEPIARIRDALLDALAATPPELAADLVDRGIILCGGTSALPKLDHALRDATDLPVLTAEHPSHCVALGLAHLLEDPALLGRVVASS